MLEGAPPDMAMFVRTVERGSFAAAAAELGVTPSAVSKGLGRLEQRLGVRLLNRTTRRLALTAEGETYLARCRRILADIADAETELARHRAVPRGLLRINSGIAFGLHQLGPALPDFMDRYPEVSVELTLTDRLVDLVEESADLAIRVGNLGDAALVARKICDLERTICAAPAYLERHGTPRRPDDLARHECITMIGAPGLRQWPFATADGPVTVAVRGRLSANNAESLLTMALRGQGIVRMADLIVGEPIRRGRLVPLLADQHRAEPVPLYAVHHSSRHRSPRLGAMIDFLVERFGHAPWRVGARG